MNFLSSAGLANDKDKEMLALGTCYFRLILLRYSIKAIDLHLGGVCRVGEREVEQLLDAQDL